jgi:hypothetical protein
MYHPEKMEFAEPMQIKEVSQALPRRQGLCLLEGDSIDETLPGFAASDNCCWMLASV